MSNHIPVLEGEVTKRKLHFFWILDDSGSMNGAKVQSLNRAINESIPAVEKALQAHPEVEVMIRAIKFSDVVNWHIGPNPIPINQFGLSWVDLDAQGSGTKMASAINMLSNELEIEKMSKRAYPPVCILISDGFCTEPEEDYEDAIRNLDSLPWGKKAVRLVIAIGDESDYDEDALLMFTNHKNDVGLIKAKNPEQLVAYIKWASVSASIGSSQSKSAPRDADKENGDAQNVVLPAQPIITGAGDVF